MERVDDKPLDEFANGDDEGLSAVHIDHGIDDAVVVVLFVGLALILVEQFLNDIGKVGRQQFTYFGTRIFGRNHAGHRHHLMEGDAIPVLNVDFLFADQTQTFLGIIDEGTECAFVLFTHRHAEDIVHLAADDTRCVVEHMLECADFAVEVAQKMFSAFGQVHDGLEVDDFGGKLVGQEFEIS